MIEKNCMPRYIGCREVSGMELAALKILVLLVAIAIGIASWESNRKKTESSTDAGRQRPKNVGGARFQMYAYRLDFAKAGELFTIEEPRDIPAHVQAAYDLRDYFYSVPIFLGDLNPSLEALSAGLLNTAFGIGLGESELQLTRSLEGPGDAAGFEFSYSRGPVNGGFRFKIRIYKRKRFGYLLAAVARDDRSLDPVTAPFDTLEFLEDQPETLPDPFESEKERHAQALNDIGIYYITNGDAGAALNFFQKAREYRPDNDVMIYNTAFALEGVDRAAEALALLRARFDASVSSPRYRARLALLEGRYGDANAGIAHYESVFAAGGGYRDEDHFAEYIALLERSGRAEAAAEAGRRYLEGGGSVEILAALAELEARRGLADEALQLLNRRYEERFLQSRLAFARINVLLETGRYKDCIDFCKEALDRGAFTSAVLHYRRAQAEIALSLMREAHESLEAARKLAPGNADVEDLLRLVSARLGRGSNSDLREPLEAAPLPPDIAPIDGAGADAEGAGLYYPLAARIHQFAANDILITTDYYYIDVLNSHAVQQFQSFQYAFDPVVESVYVNLAAVAPPDGGTPTATQLHDMYVLDHKDEDGVVAATQKNVNIPLKGVAVGARVQIVISRRRRIQADSFPWEEYFFVRSAPAGVIAVALHGPADRLAGIDAMAQGVDETQAPGWRIWAARNTPAFAPEPNMVSLREFAPGLRLWSKNADWATLTREYLERIAEKLQATDAVRAYAATAATAAKGEPGDGATVDQETEAARLFHRIQKDIQYHAIEFGVRGRIPEDAATTLRNTYGDCKDMSVLLMALLQSKGVAANLALVNRDAPCIEEAPSMEQFNHMVVYCPELDRTFDPTIKSHGANLNPPSGLGRNRLLVLDREKPRFVETGPYEKISEFRIRRKVSDGSSLNLPEADLEVEEILEINDYYAGFLRADVQAVPAQYLQAYLNNRFNRENIDILDAQIENLYEPTAPFIMKAKYISRGALKPAPDGVAARLPALFETMFIYPISFPGRQRPFQFEYPFRIVSEQNWFLSRWGALNESVAVNSNYGPLRWRFQMESRGLPENFNGQFEYQLAASRFQPDEQARLDRAINGARSALQSEVQLGPL